MKHKRIYSKFIIFFLCLALLTGCNKSTNNQTSESGSESTNTSDESSDGNTNASPISLDSIKYEEDDFYQTWDKDSVNYIKASGNKVEVEGTGASVEDNIVKITSEGTYVISGEFDDNQIQVDVGDKKKVRLILNGATINYSVNSPIYVVNAEKVIISLEEGTTNELSDAEEYQLEDSSDKLNAAIFSKSDLTFNGTGTLKINGNYKDGITSKDDLKVTGGIFDINTVDDGITGKDSIAIKEGNFAIVSGGDGLKASNDSDTTKGYIAIENGTFTITSELDAMQAATCITIGDGKYTIKSGGGSVNAVAKTGNDPFGMKGNRPDGNAFPNVTPNGNNSDSNSNTTPNGNNTDNNSTATPNADANNAGGSTSDNSTNNNTSNQTTDNGTNSSVATTSDETPSKKAFKAPSNVTILGGTFTIDSADDAIHSNNSVNVTGGNFAITAGDDGIHADTKLVIKDGTIKIDKSYEGIESAIITISGGNIHITSSDDGVNVAGGNDGSSMDAAVNPNTSNSSDSTSNYKLTIDGGKLWIDAGGDGLDSNGSIYMNGGDVIVNGPTNDGNGGLDYNNEFILNGGSLIAVGSSGMAQAPSEDSKQYAIAYTYTEAQEVGKLVHLEDSNGNNLVTFTPEKQYYWVLISTPELKKDSTYQLYSGGTATGTVTDDLYVEGSYKDGTQVMKYTLSKIVTWLTVNGEEVTASEGGMRQGGGFGPGGKAPGGMRPGDNNFNPGDNSTINPDDSTSNSSGSTTNNNLDNTTDNNTDSGNTY